MQPLPAPDAHEVAAFWARYLHVCERAPQTPQPPVEFFGDNVALADELIDLVVTGPKRATVTSVAEMEHEQQPIPVVGDQWIACDGSGRPRVVLTSTEVRVGPFSSVDAAFAWDEGEGDRSRASWVEGHERFYRRFLPTIGLEFDAEMAMVFERFELTYAEL